MGSTARWTLFRVAVVAALVAILVPVSFGRRPAHLGPSVTAQGPAPSRAVPDAAPAPSATSAVDGALHPDHVVVAIFENTAYAKMAGNKKAPYLNSLMKRSAVFTNAHAVTHPSQPNYLALFSGSTHGVKDDHCPVDLRGKPNLGRQLLDAGLGFTGYSEDLPMPGFLGCSHKRYAAKHNPWVDFDNVPASANQPYSAFPTDFSTLPTVSFVVPNLCDDMHDCGVETGDRWARAHLDPYLRWAERHNSLLIVTFDENDGSPKNQILTLFAGAGVAPRNHREPINHYRVLRTIQDFYGLPPIGQTARSSPIRDLGR
ncbi:acid phosphatase [Planosporangium flavigriseum]|uniref:Acid phosphatase n=1 Tax=Planosporangium flavigriseum TaxID=373681 RepID=A0A8J3PQF5_9ACTN|nr:alkaline phosphatase family protein [Planosporangium flavigriseum]NJC67787.1 acid phosphatase [Planosporangium flavigriseum]GIG76046.1 acid phosphatase [Planosporangium flavigriseum]